MSDGGAAYALGHSPGELKRLSVQARLFEPFTRRMLQSAGLEPGMRVLDVGSGSGDVAFLAAEFVGPQGEVIGVDRAPAAVSTATERAQAAGPQNVTFQAGDVAQMAFAEPFDAVIGRLVLLYQPDPAEILARLAGLLRPGGIIAFQEFDMGAARSFPTAPLLEQCLSWIRAAFEHTGADIAMGLKLFSTFVAAGLPQPNMSLDAAAGGGEDNPAALLVPELVRTLLPVIEKFGIATAAEVDPDSLRERMQAEILERNSVVISPSLIAAFTRKPVN